MEEVIEIAITDQKVEGGDDIALEESKDEMQNASPAVFPAELPAGVKPMMISMANMEKYEVKTGSGVKETVSFKWFNREQVMEEIQNIGFYSDFNDFKKELTAFSEEQVLIIADVNEVYGQNWMICLTTESTKDMFSRVEAEANRLIQVQRHKEEEEARVLAEEVARRNVVYEDHPIVPREWTGAEATDIHLEWLHVLPTRTLMEMTIRKPRSEFGSLLRFSDRDAEQSGLLEFRQHKDPNFELRRLEVDIGLQACPSWTSKWLAVSDWRLNKEPEANVPSMFQTVSASVGNGKRSGVSSSYEHCVSSLTPETQLLARECSKLVESSSQTPSFRRLNQAVQYHHLELTGDEMKNIQDSDITSFLLDVMPLLEGALEQNETLDMFASDFFALGSEEVAGLGNTEDNNLRETKTFADLDYSTGKCLNCIDWHPTMDDLVAVSCSDPLKFDQRVELSGNEKNSFILVWSFADMIHPLLVLQSPHECTQFSYNPDHPHLIAAGTITGQVILWDIGSLQLSVESEDRSEQQHNELIPILPKAISSIDESHKRPVSDLQWVSADCQVSSSGMLSDADETTYQFISCAADGRVLFWDCRLLSKKSTKTEEEEADTSEEQIWTPLYRTIMTHMDGAGTLHLSKFSIRGRLDTLYQKIVPESSMSDESRQLCTVSGSSLSCATEDGEFVCADWHRVNKDKDERVEWIGKDSHRGCVALCRSPFFPFLVLSVSPNSFNIWMEDQNTPLISSPLVAALQHFTCAAWSPTRPGVILIGKADGTMDVWDLSDMSHKASVTVPIAAYAITSIKFHNSASKNTHKTSSRLNDVSEKSLREERVKYSCLNTATGLKQQLLAVGDATGNLHIIEVPMNLRRRGPNELKLMKMFISREVDRMKYLASSKIKSPEEASSIEVPEAVETEPISNKAETRAYSKLIQAEENQYQELAQKLLNSLAPASSKKHRKKAT